EPPTSLIWARPARDEADKSASTQVMHGDVKHCAQLWLDLCACWLLPGRCDGWDHRHVPTTPTAAADAGAREINSARVRLAVDIGGTFTDLVAADPVSGNVVRAKADTTTNLSDGVLTALGRSGVPAESVGAFIHGTTVVINAVTERRG